MFNLIFSLSLIENSMATCVISIGIYRLLTIAAYGSANSKGDRIIKILYVYLDLDFYTYIVPRIKGTVLLWSTAGG